jgi:uncharacterized protein YdhG (YjbR/CyaY superfamily)
MKKATTTARRASVPTTVNEYLAAVSSDARGALTKLRKTIKAAAPMATEAISYGMPAFKYEGVLVYYAAFKGHCSFFPASMTVMRRYAAELKRFDTSKGTIRFPAAKPLPAALVTRMVRARVAENEARQAAREDRKRSAGAGSPALPPGRRQSPKSGGSYTLDKLRYGRKLTMHEVTASWPGLQSVNAPVPNRGGHDETRIQALEP